MVYVLLQVNLMVLQKPSQLGYDRQWLHTEANKPRCRKA